MLPWAVFVQVHAYKHIQNVNETVCTPNLVAAALLQNFHKVSVMFLLVISDVEFCWFGVLKLSQNLFPGLLVFLILTEFCSA